MTATAPAAAPPRRLPSKRWLWWVVPIVVILAVATFLTLRNPSDGVPLSPHNAAPNGARAMAQVLGQQGVDVERANSVDDLAETASGADATAVIVGGSLLSEKQWRTVVERTPVERLVLVQPGPDALAALELDADQRYGGLGFTAEAACDLPEARGLLLEAEGTRYAPSTEGDALTTCFPSADSEVTGDQAGLLLHARAEGNRPEIFVVGSDDVLRNNAVLDGDNAAVGLRVLGHHDRLVWWNVSPSDIEYSEAPPARFPPWVVPVWIVTILSLVLLMIARGRRLGRLVTEPLPVVIQASETTRARGRLYRRAGDLERASAVLRQATRRRLASYLRVGRNSSDLVTRAAQATHRDPDVIRHLLLGPPPTSESDLSVLARDLYDLEREIRPR